MDPYADLQARLKLSRPLPRVPLGRWPTPVRRLERWSAEVGVDLWVKADSEASTLYGGNKARKLELLLAEAQKKSARCILTVGGMGSHQVSAASLLAKLVDAVPAAIVFPQPVTPWTRANVALWEREKIRLFPVADAADWERGMQLANAELPAPIFLIPLGGSSPLGNLAYVAAGLELATQIGRGELPAPDEITVAAGSGGTAAGLALGLAIANVRSTRIVAIRCGSQEVCTAATIRRQIDAMIHLLGRLGGKVPAHTLPEVVLLDSGVDYGALSPSTLGTIERAKQDEGLTLESTYTAHVVGKVRERAESMPGKRVVFWQTNHPLDPQELANAPVPSALAEWFAR